MAAPMFTEEQFHSLVSSLNWAKPIWDNWLDLRNKTISRFAGPVYANFVENRRGSTPDKAPVNYIELIVTTYVQNLVARSPEFSVDTVYPDLLFKAKQVERALNHIVTNIQLDEALKEVTIDAMFLMGILKSAMGPAEDMAIPGVNSATVLPYAQRVSPEDWIHDLAAKSWGEVQYCGNRYRMTRSEIEDAVKSKRFQRSAADALYRQSNCMNDSIRSATDLSMNGSEPIEFEETFNVWDIYLPKKNLVVTLSGDFNGMDDGKKTAVPLRVFEWTGPDEGPFEILSFGWVPDNTVPLAPTQLWIDLHDSLNRMHVKLEDQATRSRNVILVSKNNADGDRIANAQDDEIIGVEDPKSIQQVHLGGVDQQVVGFQMFQRDEANRMPGNWESFGGISAQAATLGQEELVSSGASKRLQMLGGFVEKMADRVGKRMAWWLFYDPNVEIPLKVQDGDLVAIETFSSDQMAGTFQKYNFTIKSHSMSAPTTSQQVAALREIFQEIAALAPMIQEQGGEIKVNEYLGCLADLLKLPALNRIVVFDGVPRQPPEGPRGQPPSSPAVKRSVETRRSVPLSSRSGSDSALMQMMGSAGGKSTVGGYNA